MSRPTLRDIYPTIRGKRGDHNFKAGKVLYYLDVYDRLFAPFRDQEFNLLEIGVLFGGSIQLWLEYFPKARIFGVDVKNNCLVSHERFEFVQGDQSEMAFLQELGERAGPFQVVIDDGGHQYKQQIGSLIHLFPFVTEPGIYVVEDLITSYWDTGPFFGGVGEGWTTVEFLKSLVDHVNCDKRNRRAKTFSKLVSMQFYPCMAVLFKDDPDKFKIESVNSDRLPLPTRAPHE